MTNPAKYYDPAKYAVNSKVRVEAREFLQDFMSNWKLHNKLRPEQLEFGGVTAKVKNSFMYHGGDVLYELEGVPGLWHERCLLPAED